jgi:hypothetical protein
MPKPKKEDLLEDLRRNKRNRGLAEVTDVLRAFGWTCREASKENPHSMWKKGTLTLTLPTPHGRGDKSLKPAYVTLVVRLIEQGEPSEHDEEEE